MYVFTPIWSTCLDQQPSSTLITFSRLRWCSLLGLMNLQPQYKLTWFILPLNLLSLVDFPLFKFLWKKKYVYEATNGGIQGHLQRNSSRFFIVANYTRRLILVSNSTHFPESCLLGHPECDYDEKASLKQPKSLTAFENSCQGLSEGSECSSSSTEVDQQHELQLTTAVRGCTHVNRDARDRETEGQAAAHVRSVPTSKTAPILGMRVPRRSHTRIPLSAFLFAYCFALSGLTHQLCFFLRFENPAFTPFISLCFLFIIHFS